MAEPLDIIGKLFGRLIVVEQGPSTKKGHTQWLCLCDCGNKKLILGSNLTTGKVRSCGCLRFETTWKIEDLVGRVFGQLTVLAYEKVVSKRGSFWLCQCACGNQKAVSRKSLMNGDASSCGCARYIRTAESLARRAAKNKAKIPNPELLALVEKTCRDCEETKPRGDFPRNSFTSDGMGEYCKPCHNRKGRENRKKNHGSRGYHLKYRYGITQDEFNKIIELQDGLCAICQKSPTGAKPWHVDHDHSTGRVRGILCHSCNTALGNFKDDPEILRKALEYLQTAETTK